LQQEWVRASSACYRTFTLGMARSPGFGSTACDYAPYSDSVSLRLPYTVKLATDSKSLTHYTKGTQSPLRASTACTYTVSGSISLPSPGFFSPFPHGTSSLSVASAYLALGDGPPGFPRDCTCPAVLGNCFQEELWISPTGLSPSVVVLSRSLRLSAAFVTSRVNPEAAPQPRPYC
jgi:hypothetical protein